MFLIDLRKIQRPERSGWLSVLLCYVLLTTAAEITGNKGKPSLGCILVPLACWDLPPRPAEPRPKDWQVTRVHLLDPFARGKAKPKKPCACHYDYQITGKPFEHFIPADADCFEPTFDSLNDGRWHTVAEFDRFSKVEPRDPEMGPIALLPAILTLSDGNRIVNLWWDSDRVRLDCPAPVPSSVGIHITNTWPVAGASFTLDSR